MGTSSSFFHRVLNRAYIIYHISYIVTWSQTSCGNQSGSSYDQGNILVKTIKQATTRHAHADEIKVPICVHQRTPRRKLSTIFSRTAYMKCEIPLLIQDYEAVTAQVSWVKLD